MASLKDFMKNILYETVEEEEEVIVEEKPKVQTETIIIHDPVKTAVFGSLSAQQLSRPEQPVSQRKKPQRKKPVTKARPAPQEYQAVISPIFGNLQDDQKDLEQVHNAIELPKPTDNLEMIQVISPMYGAQVYVEPEKPYKKAAPAKEEREPQIITTVEEITQEEVRQEPEQDMAPAKNSTQPMDLKTFLSKK